MKKLIAFLTALLICLSALYACGEKPAQTDAPGAQGEDTAADVAAPSPDTSDDEGDKEATEAFTGTEVVITADPADKTPDGAPASASPAQSAEEKPVDTAPSPSAPAAEAAHTRSGGLKPASGKINRTENYVSEKNILIFGDGFTCANNFGDIIVHLAAADGIKLNFTSKYYDNTDNTGSYHLYETIKWDGEGEGASPVSVSQFVMNKYIEDPQNNKLDYFLLLTSRNRAATMPADCAKELKAIEYYTKRLSAAQPGVTTCLLVPSGYKDGNKSAAAVRIGLTAPTFEAHNELIRAFAKQAEGAVSGSRMSAYFCDAFEWFYKNYASHGIDLYDFNKVYPSKSGSYFMACVLYSMLFKNSSAGIPYYAFLDEDAAKALQTAADAYVKSIGVSLKAHTKTYPEKVMTIEEFDPRNSPTDPRFKNEVYPENYDYILCSTFTYMQRGTWVQYDNQSMDRVMYTFTRRKTTNGSPEEATPQRYFYTDCSAYLIMAFVDAFDYDFNGATRSDPIFDSVELGLTNWRKFYWRESEDTRTLEEIQSDFYSSLQPGDLIIFTGEARDNNVAHIMLYLGNGLCIHSTGKHASGGGENYLYKNGTDEYEAESGVVLDSIDVVGQFGEYLFPFNRKDWLVGVFRPDYAGFTPTAQVKNRLSSLRNVIAYKDTTAPEGVSVSPGGDVTFTFVIRNADDVSKTIEINDTLSKGLTFKSGDFKVNGASLSATVTVPAGKTVKAAYTATVDKTVAPGTLIQCHSAYLNGVRHNETPVLVMNTLNSDQQKLLAQTAEKTSATSDIGYVTNVYKSAFGYTFPFASNLDAILSMFSPSMTGTFAALKEKSPYKVGTLFGGAYLCASSLQTSPVRIKRVACHNLVAGDVIFTANDSSGTGARAYLYLGNGIISAVENGKVVKYSKSISDTFLETLISYPLFCVIRPSQSF
ncbi:MAG: C40 family peptidase [Clostridia bacterium]|nr:C40 family peptidase [Clostridia bacterium]